MPIFIFDTEITNALVKDDSRLTFIYDILESLNTFLNKYSSSIYCLQGKPMDIWSRLMNEFEIVSVFANEDYEPYGIARDAMVRDMLALNDIKFFLTKDQVIFAKDEVLKKDQTPYTVYTPYKNKWLALYTDKRKCNYPVDRWERYAKINFEFPRLSALNFERSTIEVAPCNFCLLYTSPSPRD